MCVVHRRRHSRYSLSVQYYCRFVRLVSFHQAFARAFYYLRDYFELLSMGDASRPVPHKLFFALRCAFSFSVRHSLLAISRSPTCSSICVLSAARTSLINRHRFAFDVETADALERLDDREAHIVPRAEARARKRTRAFALHLNAMPGPVERIPFRDDSCAAAAAIIVIFHMSSYPDAR